MTAGRCVVVVIIRFEEGTSAVLKLIETTETPAILQAVWTAVANQVRERSIVGFDQDDVGLRRDGVCPFHVQGFFHSQLLPPDWVAG